MFDYQELKTWQTAIGASVGFIALLIGAMVNYSLNRRRDRLARKEETLSIAVALYSEVIRLRKSAAFICTRISWHFYRVGVGGSQDKIDEHFLSKLPKLEAPIYSALASKLGMLEPELLLEITGFHALLREAEMSLPLMIENPNLGYTYGASYVLQPALDATEAGLRAMKMIEKKASINKPADSRIELGKTLGILAHEESMREG